MQQAVARVGRHVHGGEAQTQSLDTLIFPAFLVDGEPRGWWRTDSEIKVRLIIYQQATRPDFHSASLGASAAAVTCPPRGRPPASPPRSEGTCSLVGSLRGSVGCHILGRWRSQTACGDPECPSRLCFKKQKNDRITRQRLFSEATVLFTGGRPPSISFSLLFLFSNNLTLCS